MSGLVLGRFTVTTSGRGRGEIFKGDSGAKRMEIADGAASKACMPIL